MGLVTVIPKVKWAPMVAQIADGERVIINGGEDRDIKVGKVFNIKGERKPVYDPMTGDVIKMLPGRDVASVRITSVEDTISVAEIVDGAVTVLTVGMILEAVEGK